MSVDKQTALLRDILDSAELIRSYLDQIEHDDFMADTEKQDAVLRRFEIIGEAAKRLLRNRKRSSPTYPSAACAECATSLPMTMVMWTWKWFGKPPQTIYPL